jgi:hypothetical protein
MTEQTPTAPEAAPTPAPSPIVTWDAATARAELAAAEKSQAAPQAAEPAAGGEGAPEAAPAPAAKADAPERGPDGKFKAKEPAEKTETPEEAADDGDDDAKLPIGVHKRIARTQRQRDQAREEKDAMATRLEMLSGIVEKLQDRIRPPEPGDYRTMKEFEAAQEEFAERKAELRRVLGKEDAPKQAATASEPEGWREAQAEVAALARRDKALWATIEEDLAKPQQEQTPITQHMILGLAEADDPTAPLRHLMQHPEKAREIAALPPTRQLAAVLKLAMAPPKPAVVAPKPKATAADDPPEPTRTTGGVRPKDIHDPNISMAEYERLRLEQMKQSATGW